MKKLGFGVIGCGGIANHFHLPELSKIEEVDVVAVADIRANRAAMTARKFSVPYWYRDHHELLERDDIQAVIVATPHPTHSLLAIDAINAGKHVIIQKPMATRLEDAERVAEYARKHEDLKVMVLPFVYFDNPVFEYVRNLVNNGELGRVCMARIRVAHSGPEKYQDDVARMFAEEPSRCWFLEKEKADGGALFDMGVYSVTMAFLLFGKMKRLGCIMRTLDKKADVEDSAAIILETEQGGIIVAETAWTQARGANEVSLYGVRGTLTWDDSLGTALVRYYRSSDSSWVIPSLPEEKESQHTHRHFVRCILEGTRPIGTVDEGRYLVRIMEEARISSERGTIVELD